MSHQELVEGLRNSGEERDEFRRDPVGVMERHGAKLSEEHRRQLQEHDFSSMSDDALVDHVSSSLHMMF
jgi:hypothetical protein